MASPVANASEAVRIELPTPKPRRAPRPYDPEKAARWVKGLDTVLVLLVLILAGLLASFPARNSDLWRHLGTGRYLAGQLAQGQPALTTDPFTYTATGTWANHSWLYDLISFGLFRFTGGVGLMAVKVLLAVALAGVLLLLGRISPGAGALRSWWLAVVGAALALVVAGPWMELRPIGVSYLFLALTLYLLERPHQREQTPATLRDYWPLLLLFVLWVNLDAWFLLGPITVALYALGQLIPRSAATPEELKVRPGEPRVLALVLVAGLLACLLNPAHVRAFRLPDILTSVPEKLQQDSAFQSLFYWIGDLHYMQGAVGMSAGNMAFFALALAVIASFILEPAALRSWRPVLCAALLALAIARVASVPFFAIVAGPVLALNLGAFIARLARAQEQRNASAAEGSVAPPRPALLGRWLTIVAGVLVLAVAWPGWLQPAPFGPRRWLVQEDPSLRRAAEQLRLWHQSDSPIALKKGLIVSPAAADYFAWACPEELNFCDYRLTASWEALEDFQRARQALLHPKRGEPLAREVLAGIFRKYQIDHLILSTDQDDVTVLDPALGQLWNSATEWPTIHQQGRCVIFGWEGLNPDWHLNDKRVPGRFVSLRIRWDPRAYDAAEAKEAPADGMIQEPSPPRWWSSFVSAPAWRSLDQDEAILQLMHFDFLLKQLEYLRRRGRLFDASHLEWAGAEAAGLVGSMSLATAPGGVALIFPEVPRGTLAVLREEIQKALRGQEIKLSPQGAQVAELAFRQQMRFLQTKDDAPSSLLYLSIRAARRALQKDASSSRTWRALGLAYYQLARSTRERSWSPYPMPFLPAVRNTQCVTALTQSLRLDPDQADVHHLLAELLGKLGAMDLALDHFKEYIRLEKARGPREEEAKERFDQRMEDMDQKMKDLEGKVEDKRVLVDSKSENMRVFERARFASDEGLKGKALQLLLESNVAAFGDRGVQLELELLLLTGDTFKARAWLDPNEHREKLGPLHSARLPVQAAMYDLYQLRVQAALGDYQGADQTLKKIAHDHHLFFAGGIMSPFTGLRTNAPMDVRELVAGYVGRLLLLRGVGMTRTLVGEVEYMQVREQVYRALALAWEALSRGAEFEVLRGYLDLESGRIKDARADWERSLSLWKGAAGIPGDGLDFPCRPLAQEGLKRTDYTEKKEKGAHP